MKTIIDFVSLIEEKVQDNAKEFSHTSIVSSASFSTPDTIFNVDTTEGMTAGDIVLLNDGSIKIQLPIKSVTSSQIVINGDYHLFATGGTIKKTSAITFANEAVVLFSRFRPLKLSQTYTGTGVQNYVMPDSWLRDFSGIDNVEYPIDDIPPIYLTRKDFEILVDGTGTQYILFATAMPNGESFRIFYTTLQSFSIPDGETIESVSASDSDFNCIANLAAGIYLLAMATKYGQSVSPTISADSVNHQEKVDAFRRLAKEYFGQAASWLGISVEDLDKGRFGSSASTFSQGYRTTLSDGQPLLRDQIQIETH